MKNGWLTKTLDQISTNLDSRRVPITKGVRASGKYPYYGASGIVDYVGDYIFEEDTLLISEDGANLLARSTPIAFPASGKYWVNNHAHILKFENLTTQRFVELYLESIPLDDYITGAAQPKLNQKALNSIPIPAPPLPEQQRIVGLLDEAFAGIATAKANAEKNLQNARALFNSGFSALSSPSEQRSWVKTTVADIAAPKKWAIRTGPFGSQLLHSEFVDEGIAVLGIDNAVANEFRWGKSRFITTEKYQQLQRYRVYPGDVLITNMGTCGRCAIVPDDIPTAINTKHLCCTTLDRSKCLPGYLHAYYLHHPVAQTFLANRAKGSIMAGLNMGLIKELPVLLPPLKRQKELVEAFSSLREETQRLASLYERKLAALDALKKSLLHQAFIGEL
jgi:type I restriction enzyme S subunit